MGDMADYHNDIEMQRCEDANEAYDFPTAYTRQRVSGPIYDGDSYETIEARQRAWAENNAKYHHRMVDQYGRDSFELSQDEDAIDVSAMQTPKRKAKPKTPGWKDELRASVPTGAGSKNKRGYERNTTPTILEPKELGPKTDEWGGIPDE